MWRFCDFIVLTSILIWIFFLARTLPLLFEPAGWKITETFRVHAAHIITATRLFRPVSRGAQITYEGGGKV